MLLKCGYCSSTKYMFDYIVIIVQGFSNVDRNKIRKSIIIR